MTSIFHWFFMWKMDPMSGCDIRLVFTLPPRDSTLQYKRCVQLWNNSPYITPLVNPISWDFQALKLRKGQIVPTRPLYPVSILWDTFYSVYLLKFWNIEYFVCWKKTQGNRVKMVSFFSILIKILQKLCIFSLMICLPYNEAHQLTLQQLFSNRWGKRYFGLKINRFFL